MSGLLLETMSYNLLVNGVEKVMVAISFPCALCRVLLQVPEENLLGLTHSRNGKMDFLVAG